MKNRLYTNVGVSKDPVKNRAKVRFTNDVVTQTKRLKRCGYTEVKFFELRKPMSRLEAAQTVVGLIDNGNLSPDFLDAAQSVITRFSHPATN